MKILIKFLEKIDGYKTYLSVTYLAIVGVLKIFGLLGPEAFKALEYIGLLVFGASVRHAIKKLEIVREE